MICKAKFHQMMCWSRRGIERMRGDGMGKKSGYQWAGSDGEAERRRRALRDLLDKHNMRPTDLARAAKLPTASAIFNFLQGRSKALSQQTYEKLLAALPGTSISELTGSHNGVVFPSHSFQNVQVVQKVQAGAMQDSVRLPLSEQQEVALPVLPEDLARGAYGARLHHPGAEQLFPDQTILVCLPIAQYEGDLTTGKRVILQRVSGKKVELTIREIEETPKGVWLWPRSTHPAYQEPIPLPPIYRGGTWREGDDRFTIVAMVVGAYVPQP